MSDPSTDLTSLTMPELEQRKLRVEIAKLEAETRTHRTVEILKALAGVSGVAAAIAAIVGLQVSTKRWQTETSADREEKTETRLQQVLDDLASKDESTQLAGLASVPHFLAVVDDPRRQQLLVTLGSLLAVCESSVVSDAIVAYLGDMDLQMIGTEPAQRLLAHLVTQNRNLSRRHDLARTRRSNPYFPAESGTAEANADALGNAIATLARRGVRTDDFSGIYCVQCDFSGVSLPGVNFNDAILTFSDFSEADLQNATFDQADLEEAIFVRADLRGVSLTALPNHRPGKERNSYFRESPNPHMFEGPNFSCADLRGANFTGHPVFSMESPEIVRGFVWGPNFRDADIAGASFMGSHIFGLLALSEPSPPFTGSGSSRYLDDVRQVEFEFTERESFTDVSMAQYVEYFNHVTWAFAGTNWTEAALPGQIVELFEASRPSACGAHFDESQICIPRGTSVSNECLCEDLLPESLELTCRDFIYMTHTDDSSEQHDWPPPV